MAVDAYLVIVNNSGSVLAGESLTPFTSADDPFPVSTAKLTGSNFIEIEDYSLETMQTLNIGSQSSGAGAGRVTFNPFSVTRPVDRLSSGMFVTEATGTPYKFVDLILRKSNGEDTGSTFLGYRFQLCAIKSISWSHDDESPKETITFEYGGLGIAYRQQNADGIYGKYSYNGWNRVKNVKYDPSQP